MSNELAVYDKVTDVGSFAEKVGKSYAKMCKLDADYGAAIVLTCMQENLTPLDFARNYHMIEGKPTRRADSMLADFRSKLGGKHTIVERSSERAAIKLEHDGDSFEAEFTWQEAQESRWPWGKSDPKTGERNLKDNWSTPTDRKNMLWARLVSDSLRAFRPELITGLYTPEEIIDARAIEETGPPPVSAAEALQQARSSQPSAAGATEGRPVDVAPSPATDLPVDVPFTVEAQQSAPSEQQAKVEWTPDQKRICALFEEIAIPLEDQQAILAKRGVNKVPDLNPDEAAALRERLETRLAEQQGN